MTPRATVVFVDTPNFGGRPAFSWAPTLLVVAHKLNCIEMYIKQLDVPMNNKFYQF